MSIAWRLPDAVRISGIFRLLIWLKWTLLLRAYSRQRVRVIGSIVLVVLLVPFSVFIGVASYLFGSGSSTLPALLLRDALGVAYVVWLATPLFGFPLNESYDPSKLFVYPVPLRTIFAANAVGGLFELPTLLALPALICIGLLFCTSFWSGLVTFLAISLFLVHTIAMGQFIVLSLIGFLRSRRFRDITIVVAPLIAVVFYISQQAFARGLVHFGAETILSSPLWLAANWLPPGWAASAATSATRGDFGMSFLYLGLLCVAITVPVALASVVMRSLYFGERGAIPTGEPAIPQADAAQQGGAATASEHDEIAALAGKERKYLLREPAYKALGVQTFYTLAMMFFAFAGTGVMADRSLWGPDGYSSGGGLGQAVPYIHIFILSAVLLLATLPLSFNAFGGDASAITVLLSFPTPRWKIIAGKNVAYAPVVGGLCTVGVIGGAILMRQTDVLPLALTWVLLAVPVVIGVGNIVSVMFPHKLIVRGQTWGRTGQVSLGAGSAGCGYGLLYLACYLAAFIVMLPVAVAIIAPLIFDVRGDLFYSIPLAIVYSGLTYVGATWFAVRTLVRRESEIVSRLTPDE